MRLASTWSASLHAFQLFSFSAFQLFSFSAFQCFVDFFFPFAPPSCLFTVAQARFSAVFLETPSFT
jgi:hypothetical protein